jgi:hypothetical protein
MFGDKVRYRHREYATVKMREPIRNENWKWRVRFYPTDITSELHVQETTIRRVSSFVHSLELSFRGRV